MNKRPRQYAAEIMDLETIEERRAALKKVPKHYQKLVMKHVIIAYGKRRK